MPAHAFEQRQPEAFGQGRHGPDVESPNVLQGNFLEPQQMGATAEAEAVDFRGQARLFAAGTNDRQLGIGVFVLECREGLQQIDMALDRHQSPQRTDQPHRRIDAQHFTGLFTTVLQTFGLLDVDGIGDGIGILIGEATVTVQQILFHRWRHADEAPVTINQALGLAAPVKTVVLAKAVGNADAQRHFQPAVERQHHVHRLEAVADHYIEFFPTAELVQLPHGPQAHALEGFVGKFEVHRTVGSAHCFARPGFAAQKRGGHFIAITG
ncbi:hypothetical protein D9M69_470570 [compost metagenome]